MNNALELYNTCRSFCRKYYITPFVFSALTALLIFWSFPKGNHYLLAWIAFLPVLSVIDCSKPLPAFGFGLLSGFFANLGVLSWMGTTVGVHTKSPEQAVISLLFIALYVGLYTIGIWSLFHVTVGRYLPAGLLPLFSASFWVAMELLRTHVLTGFPWGLLGYSQWKFISMIQIAEYTGIYGVSFLVIYFNVSLFQFLKNRRIIPFAITLLIVTGIFLSGRILLHRDNMPAPGSILVASIQGNIEQNKKWNKQYEDAIVDRFTNLVMTAVEHKPDLMIWPETAVPGYLPHDEKLSVWVSSLAKRTKTFQLVGAPYHNKQEDKRKYFNSTFLVSPEGKILGWHKKVHLVPFGEFAPFASLFPKLTMLNALGQFTPGLQPTVLPVKNVHLGPMICSENLYGHIVRGFASRGADILISQTNDAWFLLTAAPFQHFTMNVFRAIENRRMVLAAGNTGITGVVEPTGRIIQTIALFRPEYMLSTLKPYTRITFYTAWGDVFAVSCLVLASLAIGWFAVRVVQGLRRKKTA